MNKIIISLSAILMVASCETKPYVKHKVKLEKVSDNCSSVSQQFQLNSNILGERYEFNKCLPEDFSKEQVTSERQGDTIVVKFVQKDSFGEKKNNSKKSDFHIILDIDAYPRYNFLTIDGETFAIVPASG